MSRRTLHVTLLAPDVGDLGEVLRFIREIRGKLGYAWPAQVNRPVSKECFDLILSLAKSAS